MNINKNGSIQVNKSWQRKPQNILSCVSKMLTHQCVFSQQTEMDCDYRTVHGSHENLW